MDYKQFVNSTISRMEQPAFEACKKALVGEYITFSIIDEDCVTREILSEKVCDYFEKLGIKLGFSLDKQIDKQIDNQFNGQIENYLKTWDSIVSPRVRQTSKGKKKDKTNENKTRARKYYDRASDIKRTRALSVWNLIDYSRIMMCLYAASW